MAAGVAWQLARVRSTASASVAETAASVPSSRLARSMARSRRWRRCGDIGTHRARRTAVEQRRTMLAPVRQEVQLVEHARDIDGPDGLWQHTDGAKRARLAHVQLAFLRGVHHERNRRGLRIALDRLYRLEPVHAGHQVIHEDHVGTALRQVLERLLGGFRRVDRHPVMLEHPAQDHPRRARVVHDQGALAHHHSFYPWRDGRQHATVW